jgi:hypothetical protein
MRASATTTSQFVVVACFVISYLPIIMLLVLRFPVCRRHARRVKPLGLGMAIILKPSSSRLMMSVEDVWLLSNLPGVHTLAAMGLLWALEKGYYAAHV